MKRFLFGFLAVLFFILNTIPYLHILADDMPTNSQYEMLGAYALSTLITSGEATELDFSDYTENDTSFLIDLGEAIFTGDWSGLAEDGLEWLGETADSIYDSYKEYISQWKYDHLGIMYSDWFPNEQIRVGPDDSYSLAKPLRELFTPRGENSPIPDPDPNYNFLDYINNINLREVVDTTNTNFRDIKSAEYFLTRSIDYPLYANYDISSCSFILQNGYSHYTNSDTPRFLDCNVSTTIIRIDVDTVANNNIHVSYNNITLTKPDLMFSAPNGWRGEYSSGYYFEFDNANSYVSNYWGVKCIGNNELDYTENTFSTLNDALTYIFNHYGNINLYVNNTPWVIVSNEPTYPIIIPGQLTIYNNQPLSYSFPYDTHIDLPDLTNIIRNAINTSGVVMWSDIADTYVDVNGQTAVAVTKIVRNDYDNLYMEQYPYPAMLIGMTDQTKFNEHLLDNSHTYLSPMGTVVQETVNVLPSELVGVLTIGAILTIFAVIINRLLE